MGFVTSLLYLRGCSCWDAVAYIGKKQRKGFGAGSSEVGGFTHLARVVFWEFGKKEHPSIVIASPYRYIGF